MSRTYIWNRIQYVSGVVTAGAVFECRFFLVFPIIRRASRPATAHSDRPLGNKKKTSFFTAVVPPIAFDTLTSRSNGTQKKKGVGKKSIDGHGNCQEDIVVDCGG